MNPQTQTNRQTTGEHRSDAPRCRSGLCSTDVMKTGCPTCVLIGVVMLPFELGFRAVRRLVRGPTDDRLQLPDTDAR